MIPGNSNQPDGNTASATLDSDWDEFSKTYRLWLYQEGQEVTADPITGEGKRRGFTQKDLEEVEKHGGGMTKTQVLLFRIRYFTDGAAIGPADFIERVFNQNRKNFGTKRTEGSRKMKGADWGDLRVIRDLRNTVISKPEQKQHTSNHP